jgi:hypothetical protein
LGALEGHSDAEKAFPKAFVKGFAKSVGGLFSAASLQLGVKMRVRQFAAAPFEKLSEGQPSHGERLSR